MNEVISLKNLQEQIAKLQADNATLRHSAERKLTLKVTAPKLDTKSGQMKGSSGAVSLYGLGQFPVTLYASQWERLLDSADTIRAFIATNAALVARK